MHCSCILVCRPRRPIYTSSLNGVTYTSDQGVAMDLRQALEQIFFIYQARPLLPQLHAVFYQGLSVDQNLMVWQECMLRCMRRMLTAKRLSCRWT